MKAILLDLGGVVFQQSGFSTELINWEIVNQLNRKYGHELCIGKDLFPDFLVEYNSLTKQNLAGQEFLKAIFDTLSMNEALVNYLKKDHEIIIVSDNYRENIAYISQRYDFASWAVQQIYSFDYEMEKENPAFFECLVKEIAYANEEVLYIDDSPKKLASAAKWGIKGLQFKSNEQVFLELKEYGI